MRDEHVYYLYKDQSTLIDLVRNSNTNYYQYNMVLLDGYGLFELKNVAFFMEKPSEENLIKSFERFLFGNKNGCQQLINWVFSDDRQYTFRK